MGLSDSMVSQEGPKGVETDILIPSPSRPPKHRKTRPKKELKKKKKKKEDKLDDRGPFQPPYSFANDTGSIMNAYPSFSHHLI